MGQTRRRLQTKEPSAVDRRHRGQKRRRRPRPWGGGWGGRLDAEDYGDGDGARIGRKRCGISTRGRSGWHRHHLGFHL